VGRANNMKKTLIIIGILVLAGVIGVSTLAIKGAALDKESKAYVDEVTPKILSNLTKETLFQYSSDELKKSAPPEEMDKLFNMFAKLGKFEEYKGSTGGANISVTTEKGKVITGNYRAKAKFENGPAEIDIKAIKKGNNWQVLGFYINSKVFLN
jgi:hypothetical protein